MMDGRGMMAEVDGRDCAVPTYRLLNDERTLVAAKCGSGNGTDTTVTTPMGRSQTS